MASTMTSCAMFQIGGGINIDVADAAAVAEHRDAAVLKNIIHKFGRAARDHQVNVAVHFKNSRDVGAVSESADRGAQRRADSSERFMPDGNQDAIGLPRFSAAFEHQAVTGLDGQRADLRNHVRTRFKYDRYHAKSAGNFLQCEAVIEFRGGQHAAKRIFQPCDIANLLCHVLDAGSGCLEPLQQRGRSLCLRASSRSSDSQSC